MQIKKNHDIRPIFSWNEPLYDVTLNEEQKNMNFFKIVCVFLDKLGSDYVFKSFIYKTYKLVE